MLGQGTNVLSWKDECDIDTAVLMVTLIDVCVCVSTHLWVGEHLCVLTRGVGRLYDTFRCCSWEAFTLVLRQCILLTWSSPIG